MRRLVLALCAISFAVVGCYPFAGGWGGFGGMDDVPFPHSTVLAAYDTGTATAEVTRDGQVETITFDRVGSGSTLNGLIGATVTWRNDDGWVLTLNAFDAGSVLAPRPSGDPAAGVYSGDVSLQRINGLDFWRADGYGMTGSRCIVDLAEVSEARVTGTATCRGLRWADGFAGSMALEPTYIEGEQPFDAEITFEALP